MLEVFVDEREGKLMDIGMGGASEMSSQPRHQCGNQSVLAGGGGVFRTKGEKQQHLNLYFCQWLIVVHIVCCQMKGEREKGEEKRPAQMPKSDRRFNVQARNQTSSSIQQHREMNVRSTKQSIATETINRKDPKEQISSSIITHKSNNCEVVTLFVSIAIVTR